ncbi:MAG: Gfo/Idh/MocA family oxidoreductase, partial [Chloroflexota bacterium]|nr:Gfo/Idh/MocA family oxidoreductase [Chloroflexota bacterium]
GFAGAWARNFLPAFRDRIEIVAIADINPEALTRSADVLAIPESGRYSSYDEMIDRVDADVCFIVIPPALRPEAVRKAASRGMAVLCEKPVAATWNQVLEIAEIVRETGIHFAVVQNYRLTNRILALKSVIDRPEMGAINTVQARMAVNYTIDTAGGAFRHLVPDAMIYEGAEHHIDQFRNLVGANGAWVLGAQWGQPWSTFGGNTCVALIVGMANGAIVQFEMNHVDRGHQNGWHNEYYRVACEGGTVTLDADHVIRLTRISDTGEEIVEEIRPESNPRDGHFAVIGRFLDWLDGGAPPETVIDEVLQTMALTFAAAESTHSGQRIEVQSVIDALPGHLKPRSATTVTSTADSGLHNG